MKQELHRQWNAAAANPREEAAHGPARRSALNFRRENGMQ